MQHAHTFNVALLKTVPMHFPRPRVLYGRSVMAVNQNVGNNVLKG